MLALSGLLILANLLCRASAKADYPLTIDSALHPPEVLQDFQKDNISASWAPSHPKDWADTKALKFQFTDGGPPPLTSYAGAITAAALSVDEKLFVTVNHSYHLTLIDFTTGTTLASQLLTTNETTPPSTVGVLLAPSGGCDVLISTEYGRTRRVSFSAQGTQIGNVTVYPGGLLSDYGSSSFSHSGRRFLTVDENTPQYNIYDLDDSNVHVVLQNQFDMSFGGNFSPDDEQVIMRSYSYNHPGSTKLFNATTGATVRDFGDTESMIAIISPDGKLLAADQGSDALHIWPLTNSSLEPVTLPFPVRVVNGLTDLAWSPDSNFLAAGSRGNIFVWKLSPTPTLVQNYTYIARGHDVQSMSWVRGSKRLAYRTFGGLEIYDFDTNLKYRWGFTPYAHWTDYVGHFFSRTVFVKSKGWIGGLDSDANVRFWEDPA